MLEEIAFCPHCGVIFDEKPGAEIWTCRNCGNKTPYGQVIFGLFTPKDAELLRHPLMEQQLGGKTHEN